MKRLPAVDALSVFLAVSLLPGLCGAMQARLEIPVSGLDSGVRIKHAGNVDCVVFIDSPEGEQQLAAAVGQNTTVTDI